MKKIKTILIFLSCIVLYCIPLGAIYLISTREIKEYQIDVKDVFKEKAYGELKETTRMDIKENYEISGEIISQTYRSVKIPYSDEQTLKLNIEVEDEVHTGEKIGYLGDGKEVYSSCNGIVKEINLEGEEPNIKVLSFDRLLLKANVKKEIAQKLNGELTDENGIKYEVVEKSNQMIEGGMEVLLYIKQNNCYNYGEKVNNLLLYTGKEFENVITIDQSCVYTKSGGTDKYVRICNQMGEYVKEQRVEVSFDAGDNVCVTGIDENVLCDSGYKYVINDNENNKLTESIQDQQYSDE